MAMYAGVFDDLPSKIGAQDVVLDVILDGVVSLLRAGVRR